MKTVTLNAPTPDVKALLDEAREEDVVVQCGDGTEFILAAVDDFDREVARTRMNKELMAFLDEQAKERPTIPLHEVRRQLGLR